MPRHETGEQEETIKVQRKAWERETGSWDKIEITEGYKRQS